MNLLISGLGGSLFPYLYNRLKGKYNLFFVDSNDRLTKLYPDLFFFHAPKVTDPQYWDLIREIIEKYKINFYIPLIDEEIVGAKTIYDGFNNLHVMTPTIDFTKLCLNKFELMMKLRDKGISDVSSKTGDQFEWEFNPPIFVKPISGRGSRGIKKINNEEQLRAYYVLEDYRPNEILIQPFLTGLEYTVGVLTNNKNKLLAISSKRIIAKKGITQIAVSENNPLIDEVASNIVEKFNPCGPLNIQLILDQENKVRIFEINPRFSTTTIMEFEGGLDLFSLYIDNLDKDYDLEILRPKAGITLHRRWESVFYDE